jgi:hypothetical protein
MAPSAIGVVAVIPVSVGCDGGTEDNDRDQTRFAHRAIQLYWAMVTARLANERDCNCDARGIFAANSGLTPLF